MRSAFIQFGDGRLSTEADPKTLAAALRDPQSIFWVDMNNPTDDDYALLDDVFGFHPLAIEDSIHRSQRPKIEAYRHVGDAIDQGYFYMVIHGPSTGSTHPPIRMRELNLFVSARYLVTIHEKPIKAIADLSTRAASDARIVLEPGIDMLLHNIMDHMMDNYQPILDQFQADLDTLEDAAVSDPTPDLLQRIAAHRRELLRLRRAIGPQRDVLGQITRGEVPFIRESARVYFRDVQDHLNRAVETIEVYRDLVQGARDIYMSSVSNDLNQIMKTLTVISVIALPMTVVTSFFGMNFEGIAIMHASWMFYFSMLTTTGLVVAMLIFFRHKEWL